MRAILLLFLLPALAFAAGGSPNLVELRKTAESGDAAAQFSLGEMYRNGTGVPRDLAEGFKWCRKAAEQGYAPAQCEIGIIYHNGNGVPVDEIEALAWIILSAEKGDKHMIQMRDMAKHEIEFRFGPETVLKAQQRSNELAAMVAAAQRPQ